MILLTSRPPRSPLAHLERVKFTPNYDPNLSIRSRSPVYIANFHSSPSDASPRVPPVPMLIPAQPAIPHNLHGSTVPGPLRAVTNVLKQPPADLGRRLTVANLGTPGGKMVGFPRTHQHKLPVPKRVRFHGTEIVIPPLRDLPVSPAIPTENSPDEAQKPSNLLGAPGQTALSPSLVVPYENTRSASSDHTYVPPTLDHEASALDELPDSPSVYSPTPPNSSVLFVSNLLERGSPQLDLEVIDIGYHHSWDEDPSDEQPTDEQPRSEDELPSISKDVSGEPHRLESAVNEQVPKNQRGNSAELLLHWGHVSIVAVASGVAKAWRKRAQITVATRKSNGTNKVGNRHQEESAGQS